MIGKKHLSGVFIAVVLMLCLAVSVSAQGVALTVGQPVLAQVSTETPVAQFSYSAEEAQVISMQAFGETLQPTITLLRDGALVTQAANAEGELIVALEAIVTPGNYVIEISAANATSGTAVLLIQSANAIPVTDLVAGHIVSGEASPDSALALYRVSALPEVSFVYVESGLENSGAIVRLVNEANEQQSGMFAADLLGGRFNIPANGVFRVEVAHSGADQTEPYSICWVAASAEGCGSTPVVTATEAVVPVSAAACTVTPAGSAVNVRASASTNASIIATLAAGVSAQVLGVAPGNFFYNIQLGGVNGWVSASVVNVIGDCANLPVVEPPQFVPVATQPPVAQPTQPPAQPTEAPQQPPLQPTQAPSGPCLLTVNSPTNVYQIPEAIIDYLQDQVGAGGQLIPTGRLADNSWWQTNYGGAWIQTGLFGGSVTVSGNCNLPVVSAPQQAPSTCLLSVVGNTNVYTAPQAGNAYLMSVVAPGGELIVTGRLSGNDWYQTNYGGGWVQASVIGSGLEVASGNCGNVPVVSAP